MKRFPVTPHEIRRREDELRRLMAQVSTRRAYGVAIRATEHEWDLMPDRYWSSEDAEKFASVLSRDIPPQDILIARVDQ